VEIPFQEGQIVKAAVGYNCTYLLTRDGKVFGWGENDESQLGQGHVSAVEDIVHVPIPERVKLIAAGWDFGAAVTESRSLYTWGSPGFGALGRLKSNHFPAKVELEDVVDVVCGSAFMFATTGIHSVNWREDRPSLAPPLTSLPNGKGIP
jgi:alpha-tubulin suppressor-like RCC1 family protein